MPRLVKKTAKGPMVVGDKRICMCGLSENQPFCDSSHKKTRDEADDKLYWYGSGQAEEIATESENCSCGECNHGDCDCSDKGCNGDCGKDGCCGGHCQH